jgi:hypothetical protein
MPEKCQTCARPFNLGPVRRLFLLSGLLLVAAGCGGGPTIPAAHLSRLVLQPADLGSQFSQFGVGAQSQLDNQGTGRADPQRDGREGGWIARYHRPGSTKTKGPLVVESRADVFSSSGGAKKDLALYAGLFGRSPGRERHVFSVDGLGDAAEAVTFVQPGGVPLRFYRVAWRYRNATASVTVEGFDDKVGRADAVALAQKQQQRLQHG